ncbi:MAG TPA: C4-dicarboxylic acid transporter DauA, partial [Polyangiaceae bacterium]
PLPIGTAVRRVLARGYRASDLKSDVLAGVLVGVVALPLSMALAIAVGVPPQHGLYTAIVGGAVVALLGGCKFQVTGPTAAFVVILAPITSKFGLSGLLTAGMMAGLLLIGMGFARLGTLVRFIPYPVTTGFTTGIAIVIAALQVKDAFGLRPAKLPDHFVERVGALWSARGTAQWQEVAVAATTLGLLVGIPRLTKRLPAPLFALSFSAAAAALLHRFVAGFDIATIGSRFHSTVSGVQIAGIPRVLPSLGLPWGTSGLSFADVRELLSGAFAIAMLGAIESLLSATVADGMTNTRHDSNAELLALGVGNLLVPFFGGIPATGALARTATNIRAGARSPVAAVVHALVVLLSILVLSPLLAYIPMASLAALLMLVAWNMSEAHNFVGIVKVAPRSDVAVLLICFLLTIVFDMVVAVSVGVVLAAVLFMRRMAGLTESRLTLDSSTEEDDVDAPPPGVILYEINGPLFFGAAQRAMSALHASSTDRFRVLVLNLARVPVIDATGLAALENAISHVLRQKKKVVIAGPLPKPQSVFDKAHLEQKYPGLSIVESLENAFQLAGTLAAVVVPETPAIDRGALGGERRVHRHE